MRTVQLYIEGERDSGNYSEVELFDDESINLSLSVQNIQDISKVFTDFSQSFTVPASSINNAIFKHFYENDVDLDPALIDQRLKRNAFIEIDRTPFRNGKIQLEKSNLKDGQAQSYSITFYGDLVTLKDTFSDDKLSDLDFDSLNHELNGSEIYNRITDGTTDYDIRYPLITSDSLWSYGNSTSTDISTSTGRISYLDLFPALKVARIFEAIESKYSINFNGLFLSDERFTNLFLWCKNRESSEIQTDTQLINIYDDGGSFPFSTSANDVTVQGNPIFSSGSISVSLNVTFAQNLNNYFIQVYVNDSLHQTIEGSGIGSYLLYTNTDVSSSFPNKVKCFIYGSDDIVINSNYVYDRSVVDFTGTHTTTTATGLNLANNLIANTNLKTYMPDMKVADFFSGVLKQFNLTCYPLSINTFEIEPLDYWYKKGALNDITNFVDVDSIDVAKVPLYKSINFEYEESESFLNVEYKNKFSKGYGNIRTNYDFDGSDFEVKVPFENLKFVKFNNQDIQVGYALNSDYEPYIPKPILLYMREETSINNIKFFDGSTESNITEYMPFGQDFNSNGLEYSLNFSQDISSFLLQPVPNSIYSIYYNNYLQQLFNYKNRLTSIKANFPTSLITNLKLNDRLIIRDKRYIINNIKTNLTSGEVDLELLNDFREISNANVTNELLPIGGVINVPVLVENKVESVTATTPTVGITLGATTTFTSDGFLEVTYPANPNGGFERITEDSQERVTERIDTRRSESGSEYIIEIDLESTYFNGDTKNESLFYIQGL